MNNELLAFVRADMRPAMGVTEPSAIAFCTASAAELCEGSIARIDVTLNPGMYKNAYTCGIPHSEDVGAEYAAAIGALVRDSSKGLLIFDAMQPDTAVTANALVRDGKVNVSVSSEKKELYIEAVVKTASGSARAVVSGSHTHIVLLERNGELLPDERRMAAETAAASCSAENGAEHLSVITEYELRDFYDTAKDTPAEELSFIADAYRTNLALADEAISGEGYPITKKLLKDAGPNDPEGFRHNALLLATAASEARVLGAPLPAMSITGSGNHGIIATLPLYAQMKAGGYSEEELHRATLLSYLVTEYIKEYSGKLSAFCGCGIAAGTGMACGLTFMRGGSCEQVEMALANMASSITGMICTGGNHACCMKVMAAVDIAIHSADLAMAGISINTKNGILGAAAEETMRYMGQIACPGMTETDNEILKILERKASV